MEQLIINTATVRRLTNSVAFLMDAIVEDGGYNENTQFRSECLYEDLNELIYYLETFIERSKFYNLVNAKLFLKKADFNNAKLELYKFIVLYKSLK